MIYLFFIVTLYLICVSYAGKATDPSYHQISSNIQALRDKINIEPDNGSLWGQLALHLQVADVQFHEDSITMQPEALYCFEKAISLTNDNKISLAFYHRKGMLLKMMSRGVEAIEAHQWVYDNSEYPIDKASSLVNMGHSYSMMGQISEANRVFKEAMELHPYGFGNYIALVESYIELKQFQTDDWRVLYEQVEGFIVKWEKASKKGKLSELYDTRSDLSEGDESVPGTVYWALYLIGDKIKDFDRAWQYLEKAHVLQKLKNPSKSTMEDAENQLETIRNIFVKGFWPNQQESGVGLTTKIPVFIVGMMRSGSTLTETMLDAHSQIYGAGEDSIFNNHLDAVRNAIVEASIVDNEDADVIKARASGVSHLPNTAKQVSKHGKQIVKKMVALARNSTRDASGKIDKSVKVKHVVDKMLFNYRNIGFIHLLYPNASILHTMRDPMDTLFSCYKHKFDDSGLEWSLDAEALAHQYYLYLLNMYHFRMVLPGRVKDIRYEEVIHNPETVMRPIIRALGDVQWEENILKFHSTNRIVHTHSMTQVRQGLYSKSIGGWRKYAKQMQPIVRALKKYIKKLKKLPRSELALPYPNDINWELDANWKKYDVIGGELPVEADYYTGKPIVGKPAPSAVESGYSPKQNPSNPTPSRDPKVSTKHPKSQSVSVAEDKTRRKGKSKSKSKSKKSKEKKSKKTKKTKKAKKSKTAKKQEEEKMKESVGVSVGTAASADLVIPKPIQKELQTVYDEIVRKTRIQSIERVYQLAASFGDGGMKNDLLDELTALAYVLINSRQFADAVTIFEYIDTAIEKISKSNVKQKKPAVTANSAILIGYGTALAQSNQLEHAIKIFTRVINLRKRTKGASKTKPTQKHIQDLVDVYSRRGEVYSAVGNLDAALMDFDAAINILEGKRGQGIPQEAYAHLYQSRGVGWYKKAVYTKALPDIQAADRLAPNDYKNWIWMGKVLKEFADTRGCLAALDKSLQLQPTGNKEAIMEKAIALLEVSKWEEAISLIEQVLALDPHHKLAWGYLGLMYISMGRHTDALNNFDKTLKTDPNDTTVMQMTGVCLIGEARFGEAIGMFDRALKVAPEHIVWFHREVAYMLWMNLDNPVISYYPDRLLNPRVSEELSQQSSWKQLVAQGYSPIASSKLAKSLKAKIKTNQVGDVSGSFTMTTEAREVLNHTLYLAKWIQLTSPGFLPNLRQHRMFGITALHLAQLLRFNCQLKLKYPHSEAHGLVIPNAASSDRKYTNDYFYLKNETDFNSKYGNVEDGAATVLSSTIDGTYYDMLGSNEHEYIIPPHYHVFNWRDFADVAVRWRQLSEPRDLVLWIDRLPLAQTGGKLGLSTHLLSGVFKNHRYYPYHDMGVQVVARVIGEKGYIFSMEHNDRVVYLSKKQIEQAKIATSVEELYDAVGGYNMSILCPCNSIQHPGLVLNGTRLIAQKGSKEGWELTISTPSSTDRYIHFEAELDFVVNTLVNPALMEFMSLESEIRNLKQAGAGTKDQALLTDLEARLATKKYEVIRGGLIYFFYWVHFAPLSRGTSATGYAFMVAHILAVGEHIVDSVPAKKQLDFEGMFRADPSEFVDAVYPWLSNRMETTIPHEYLDYKKGYRLSDIFNTSRSMMSIFTAQPGEEAFRKKYTF